MSTNSPRGRTTVSNRITMTTGNNSNNNSSTTNAPAFHPPPIALPAAEARRGRAALSPKRSHSRSHSRSPKRIITINVEERQMSKSDFFEICRQSLKLGRELYCVILAFKGASYHCTVLLNHNGHPGEFLIYFYNTNRPTGDMPNILDDDNKISFMYLSVDYKMGDSAITTRVDFRPINGLKKLESIIYIRCLFYWMIRHESYTITDAACGLCDGNKDTEYPLLLYRILNPRENGSMCHVNEISIYYQYFRKHYYDFNTATAVQGELIDFNKPEYAEYLAKMRSMNFDLRDGRGPKPYEPFKRSDGNCAMHAERLNALKNILFFTETPYRKLHRDLGRFNVNNHDCIYYPKSKSPKSKSPKGAAEP